MLENLKNGSEAFRSGPPQGGEGYLLLCDQFCMALKDLPAFFFIRIFSQRIGRPGQVGSAEEIVVRKVGHILQMQFIIKGAVDPFLPNEQGQQIRVAKEKGLG